MQFDLIVIVALLGFSLVLAVLQIRSRGRLRELRRHIREAQEGKLESVAQAGGSGRFISGLIDDYNTMITTLHTMFRTVEECQGRVLNERNKIEAILQSLPGVLLSVADDLRLTTVNKKAEELFGCPQEQLVGRSLFDLLQLSEGDREILRDAFLYKLQVCNQEIALQLNGQLHWFSLNMAFISASESDMGAVLILQDMTEYRQLQESMAMREKLVAMGQLAAGVAHELNTPLGNILGYSQLIQEKLDDKKKLIRYARVVSDETKRCSRIVQDLLNYARKEQCHGDTCEINGLIQELIDTFISCRMKRYNIDMSLDLAQGDLVAEGDCGQLDIVLTNLLLNSVHAIEGVTAPRITMRTGLDDHGFVQITIEDNGPGVASDMRGRIFDPFFTTKEVGSGSGLGLSISQAMLSKRGGFIKYDPEFQDGARFIIKLPAVRSGGHYLAGTG
ncbi:MAG: PAS domain-containing protein [Proteobacteria bacterium]|nr:MAG: PAS domain-containing protein [Pseudomonadota bacterium]